MNRERLDRIISIVIVVAALAVVAILLWIGATPR